MALQAPTQKGQDGADPPAKQGDHERVGLLLEDEEALATNGGANASFVTRAPRGYLRMLCFSLVNTLLLLGSYSLHGSIVSVDSTVHWKDCNSGSAAQPSGGNDDQVLAWPQRTNVLYGHVHMAKSGGTELNGQMALKYERVCGHKGYSYDAYEFNNRQEEWVQQHPDETLTEMVGPPDSHTKLVGDYNRGRVYPVWMEEIGYYDCDWISQERPFDFWKTIKDKLDPSLQLELHVPCREPLNYLMSQCSFKSLQFNCNHDSIPANVEKCLFTMNRFDDQPNSMPPNTTLKCFNPLPIDPYVDYMNGRLQPQRFQRSYMHRETNKPRNKDAECIWKDQELQRLVKEHLKTIPIFRFCNKCMGSKDDLLFAGK